MALFGNPYFVGFAVIYLVALAVWTFAGGQPLVEPLFILVIFGIILPGVAYLICRRGERLYTRVEISRKEGRILALYLLFMVVYLTWGTDWLDGAIYSVFPETPQLDLAVTLVKKVLFFVIIPLALFARLFGYSLRDFGFVRDWRAVFSGRHLAVMLVVAAALVAVQLFFGQGAKSLGTGEFAVSAILIGGAVYFVFLVIDVGLVEEFFFRSLVQTRMAALLNSEIGGLFAMALIFGLAHAPGLYLRGASELTGLGTDPGLWLVLSHSIVTLSVAGLVFGVIWALTRNIYILMILHAAGDLLPNLPEFLRTAG